MTDDPRISEFLSAAGWGDSVVARLAGDASNRRYLRVTRGGGTAVLMDASPERGEDVRPFLAVTEWLLGCGLSAPRVLAADANAGLLLLEDLGDDLYARHLARRPADEPALYAAAVDLLAGLAEAPPPLVTATPDPTARAALSDRREATPLPPPPPSAVGGKAGRGLSPPSVRGDGPGAARARPLPLLPYDQAALDREAGLFTRWWLPAVAPVSPGMTEHFAGLVREATAPVAAARDAVVLRDYHAENLLWLPGRAGVARVGLLDYQDALAGHAAYDLVSLLEDARRDTGEALRKAMVARYLAARPELEAEAFRAAYAILGAQRNLKIIGIFARLARRDEKPRYLGLIPRVWEHLQRDFLHPALAPLATWVARYAPAPEPAVLSRAGQVVPA